MVQPWPFPFDILNIKTYMISWDSFILRFQVRNVKIYVHICITKDASWDFTARMSRLACKIIWQACILRLQCRNVKTRVRNYLTRMHLETLRSECQDPCAWFSVEHVSWDFERQMSRFMYIIVSWYLHTPTQPTHIGKKISPSTTQPTTHPTEHPVRGNTNSKICVSAFFGATCKYHDKANHDQSWRFFG